MRICPQCGTRFEQPLQFCPNDGAQTYEALDNQAPPPDPLIGRVIDGRYRIEQQIGEGGMGVVYSATHAALNKRLALKVLRGDNSKDADVVQRFMQEAQAATSIGHANIIDINDFGRLPDGSVYFVMEFLDGVALTDMISRGGSVPMQDAIHLIRQMASALEAAHARGIVHRDLKPDNIFVIKQGNDGLFVKVLDFGIAKVGGASSKLTKTGMIFGTPHYMSPEQAAGHSVDQRTDIYALGVIMYEMFTGKVPFDADTFMGILSKHMFEPPARPVVASGGAALGALESVILKALEKKPDQRYQSMGELLVDLETIAAGGQVAPHASGAAAPPGGLADALEPPSHAEVGVARASGGGSSLLMVALAIIALVVIGGGVGAAVFFLAGDDDGHVLAQAPTDAPPPPSPNPSADSTGSTANGEEGEGGEGSDQGDGSGEGGGTGGSTEEVSAEVPPTPQPVVSMVEVRSDPPGAEVLIDGIMVGNAPVTVPKPASGQRTLTLRLRGHRESTVRINAESGESMSVTLERESVRRRPPTPPREPVAQPATSRPPPPPPPTTRPRTGSEVVDPWAN